MRILVQKYGGSSLASLERIKEVAGDGSFQALDASYPIHETYWPDWLKTEVEKFHRYRGI